jgi:hypothetical protein
MSISRGLGRSKASVQVRGPLWHFVTYYFLRWGVISPCPTPKLEGHPLSVVRDCLFNTFAAVLHIWWPSLLSATWRRAIPWWHGTHLTWRVLTLWVDFHPARKRPTFFFWKRIFITVIICPVQSKQNPFHKFLPCLSKNLLYYPCVPMPPKQYISSIEYSPPTHTCIFNFLYTCYLFRPSLLNLITGTIWCEEYRYISHSVSHAILQITFEEPSICVLISESQG